MIPGYFTALVDFLEPPAWTKRALCRNPDDYDEFFPGAGVVRDDLTEFCQAHCTVAVTCLTTALDRREPHGIWGGLNTAQRAVLLADDDARKTAIDALNNRQEDTQ